MDCSYNVMFSKSARLYQVPFVVVFLETKANCIFVSGKSNLYTIHCFYEGKEKG